MGNMSYCRFENTLDDLRDCYENMDNEHISTIEDKARDKLINLCVDIALDYGCIVERPTFVDEVNQPVIERRICTTCGTTFISGDELKCQQCR